MLKKFIGDLKREFRGYNGSRLMQDVLAGVTVAAVALPLALAFGVSSGADAAAGLVTAIIGGLIIGILGGASFQISGPTGAMSAILIGIVAQYGLQGVFVASLAAGVVILLAGVLRLGKLVNLIPTSVVMGFTSGIAIIIALGQVDNFFGTTSVGSSALEKLASYVTVGFHPNWQAVVIGLFVVLFMAFWPKKLNAKVPGSLVAIILATIITEAAGFDSLAKVGDIPRSILLETRLNLSQINLEMLQNLVSPIISIAMLGMIESLLCGASASRMKDEPFDANRELIAQGVGNIVLPFFGGVPATAAIARTSVAIKSGLQTRLTGVVHSVVLLLAMLLLSGVMSRLPLSALAGVLMVTAWRMNEWHGIKTIFGRKIWTGVIQFMITMAATVVFDLTIAIVIGIATALVMFVWNAAHLKVETVHVDHERVARLNRMGVSLTDEKASGILITYLNGSLFFANCGELKRAMENIDLKGCEHLILSMRGVPAADISGVQTLMEACEAISKQGVCISVCGVQQSVRSFFDKVGLTDQVGSDHFYGNASEALIDAMTREHVQQTA
ncbi:MAG: SulP family inorganic anion transporter [Clostridia bacterium]|nr:SulP family inorganic anion transporter [Clostridia bacterium]